MHFIPARSRKPQEEGKRSSLPEGIRGKQSKDLATDFIITDLGVTTGCACLKCRLVNEAALEEERTRQLLSRVAEGNILAFWTLWDLYKGHLYRLCLWQMGGVQADAEDALSRAMLRALEKLPNNACKIRNCKAWLNRLTLNLCVDMHRERKRQVRRLESIDNSLPGASERVLAKMESPEEGLINREVFAYVCSAVDDLPPRLREPFVLRFFQEMDYREIAECLILSTDNVRKRIQQARDILREELSRFLQGSVGHRPGIVANLAVLPKSASLLGRPPSSSRPGLPAV
ncbi:MAG TPA: RNA polymerase sigma factor [Blastocatellia bacterium]|nr:RNA polymerase sigma factor [Blastocatellia bacterium]